MMHMTQRNSEQGSVHVIIITVVIAAVIAALAVVFWQNFMNDNTANNGSSVQTAEEEMASRDQMTLKTATIDEDFGTQLSFKYLDEWRLERTIDGDKTDIWTEDIQITSPSGKYVVTYKIGSGGGLGGACDESTAGVIENFSYEILPEFPEMSFVTYSINGSSPTTNDGTVGMHRAESIGSLINTSNAKRIESGVSACELYFSGVFLLKNGGPNTSQNPVSLLDASIEDTNADATMDIDPSILDGEYGVAQGILFSTTR